MEKKNVWETYDENQLQELEQHAKEYMDFLDNGKTERECIDLIVNKIEQEGYRELQVLIKENQPLKKGDKVYAVWMNKSILMVADVNFYCRPVFFHYYAMDRQRNRYPLVFLYASIIMSIQISKSSLFIHRVLLHIQPGRIDVSSKNIHALFHRFFSDLKHNDRLIHPHRIDFISLFQGLVLLNQPGSMR